jgi:hypothetical protein
VGGALVLAVVTAIIGNKPAAAPGELLPGMANTIAVVVGVSAVGLLVTGGVLIARRRGGAASGVVAAPALPAEPELALTEAG